MACKLQVIYVPEGFEVREGLKLTEDYKVHSLHLQRTVNLTTISAVFQRKGVKCQSLPITFANSIQYKGCSHRWQSVQKSVSGSHFKHNITSDSASFLQKNSF